MLKTKQRLLIIDNKHSFYYRQQRRNKRNKVIKLLLFIIFVSSVFAAVSKVSAQSNEQKVDKNSLIHGPKLVFNHPDQQLNFAFPMDSTVNIEINGLIAHAEITQTFINPHDMQLEGKYQFPLPENSAVNYLLIKMKNKVIEGKIMEKQQAKIAYKKAKQQGEKAGLVEQQRANLFTNTIANIPAQSQVMVTIKFVMPITYNAGTFNLRMPLAITQRYHPHDFTTPPDSIKNTSFATSLAQLSTSQASVNIALNNGVPISQITSSSHQLNIKAQNSLLSNYLISLKEQQTTADKDFNLSWKITQDSEPKITSFTEQIGDDYFTLLSVFPPHQQSKATVARDIIFIIDTSGSMQGKSIEQARKSLNKALTTLSEQDSFNVIAFNSTAKALFTDTHMADKMNIEQAKGFIDKLSADGGTEMYRPLSDALLMKRSPLQSAKAIRQIVFITDGAVANEFELMQLLNNSSNNFRLYTVGIGSAPNGYFMKKAAQFGRGSYIFIQNLNEVEQKTTELMTKISQPFITDIQLLLDQNIHQEAAIYPKKIPDIYLNEPLQVAIKSKLPISSAQILGNKSTDSWYQQIVIDDQQPATAISTIWARQKIEDLLDGLIIGKNKEQVKASVIETSIAHQIISPYTSFIALEKQPTAKLLLAQKSQSKAARLMLANENLRVALPQTALGWQLQLAIGISLMLLAYVLSQINRFRHAKHIH